MKKITESMLQTAILTYLEWYSKTHKIYYFRSSAGQVRLDSGRYFRTGKPGVPDISVCAGGYIGLEVKTEKGRQSALQKKAEAEIVAAGGEYKIIRSLEDVKKIFPMDKP